MPPFGYVTQTIKVAKWFGCKKGNVLSNWIRREIPEHRIKYAEDKGHPRETWLIKEDKPPPNQANESTPGYNKLPTYKDLCHAVKTIYESKHNEIITALGMNLKIYLDSLNQKKQIQKLDLCVKKLEAEAKQRKNIISMKEYKDAS